ncbi:MAG: putative quinol monooxygenase [Acidimicrobiales bacterium]|nr:putative quinol monooxygenase [Acidimicrobiales bacterium]
MIAGSARVRADRLDAALEAASRMAEASRDEPGCVDYRFSIDIEDPNTVRIFEHWESSESLERHFAAPHFLAFSELLGDVLDGQPEFSRYEVADVRPLFG